MRWGLVPYWSKDLKMSFSTINARADSVATKPAFVKPGSGALLSLGAFWHDLLTVFRVIRHIDASFAGFGALGNILIVLCHGQHCELGFWIMYLGGHLPSFFCTSDPVFRSPIYERHRHSLHAWR